MLAGSALFIKLGLTTSMKLPTPWFCYQIWHWNPVILFFFTVVTYGFILEKNVFTRLVDSNFTQRFYMSIPKSGSKPNSWLSATTISAFTGSISSTASMIILTPCLWRTLPSTVSMSIFCQPQDSTHWSTQNGPRTSRIHQYNALDSINLNYGQHLFKTIWGETGTNVSPLSSFSSTHRHDVAYLSASKAVHFHLHLSYGPTAPLSMLTSWKVVQFRAVVTHLTTPWLADLSV